MRFIQYRSHMLFSQQSLPVIQLCALPLIIFVVARFSIAGQRVPRLLLFLTVAMALGAFSLGYTTRTLDDTRIVVSRFADDPLGSDSRIFRERLDRNLGAISSLRVVRFPGSFSSYSAVRKKFANSRRYDAIIWGKTDAYTLQFPNKSKSENSRPSLMGLTLVTQVPSISMSRSQDSGSIQFVSDLLAALFSSRESSVVTEARADILLEDAVRIESRWRSRAHRALPAWLLGVHALERAVVEAEYQPGEIECALKHFANASRMFLPSSNPEMAATLYNSWGVALALKGWMSGDRNALTQAEALFERAIETKKFSSGKGFSERAIQAARSNVLLLQKRVRKYLPARTAPAHALAREPHHEKKKNSRKR